MLRERNPLWGLLQLRMPPVHNFTSLIDCSDSFCVVCVYRGSSPGQHMSVGVVKLSRWLLLYIVFFFPWHIVWYDADCIFIENKHLFNCAMHPEVVPVSRIHSCTELSYVYGASKGKPGGWSWSFLWVYLQ